MSCTINVPVPYVYLIHMMISTIVSELYFMLSFLCLTNNAQYTLGVEGLARKVIIIYPS